jgi:hypothetical protein
MTWEHGTTDYGIVRYPYDLDLQVGDHVHMATWWLRQEWFDDIEGRIVGFSDSGRYAKVAMLDGRTLFIQRANLEPLGAT